MIKGFLNNVRFFLCSYTEKVWKGLVFKLFQGYYSNQWNQILQVLSNGVRNQTVTFLVRYAFQTMIHAVWHDRNIRRMGEHPMIWSRLLSSIDEQVRNKITAIQRTRGKWHENAMSVWFGTRWLSFHFPHSIVCFKSVFF